MDDKGTTGKTEGMRQHQSMAQDGAPLKGGDFGCQPMSSFRGKDMGGPKGKEMAIEDRASAPPARHSRGKMAAPAEPDHGKHAW